MSDVYGVRVLYNPTTEEMRALAKQDPAGELRTILDQAGHLYAFQASFATHNEIAATLDVNVYTSVMSGCKLIGNGLYLLYVHNGTRETSGLAFLPVQEQS